MQHRSVRRVIHSTLLAVSILTSACVRVSVTRLGVAGEPALSPDSVRVFATATPEGYTEVAVLRATRFLASDSKVLGALRERAARLGANGLLLLNTRGPVASGGSGTGVIIGGRNNGSIIVGQGQVEVDEFERAVAIRWTASSATSPTPNPRD